MQAHERGVERGCRAIQVFNQSPRQWRPTRWKDDDVARFLDLMRDGPVDSVTIHAVYLINPATKDRDLRKKSAASLIHALRMGDEIKADGVVLHPGSTVGEPHDQALARAGKMLAHVLGESERCRLLLENTAGAGNTLGRCFEELGELIGLADGHRRLGLCLDSCHMLASGFDITTADKLAEVIDRCGESVGLKRLRCLHVNDSQAPLGLKPRPARHPRQGRARRARLRRLPVGAALREAARAVRGPGHRRARAGQGGRGPDEGAAPQRAARAPATALELSAAGAAGSSRSGRPRRPGARVAGRLRAGSSPVMRMIGTEAGVRSPLASKRKLPSRPFRTRLALSSSSTEPGSRRSGRWRPSRAPPPARPRARTRRRERRSRP